MTKQRGVFRAERWKKFVWPEVALFLLLLLGVPITNHTRGHIMPGSCVEEGEKQQIGFGFIGWFEPIGLTSASGISCL